MKIESTEFGYEVTSQVLTAKGPGLHVTSGPLALTSEQYQLNLLTGEAEARGNVVVTSKSDDGHPHVTRSEVVTITGNRLKPR